MTHTMALMIETSATLWFKIIVVIAFLVTIINQVRFLPKQNVFTIVAFIALFSSGILLMGEETGLPFGPFFYTENLGWRIFYRVPWLIPLLWIVAVINSRDVARLVMQPWRKARNYGWWVIGLSCLLMLIFDAVLEPYATRASHFWIWESQDVTPIWYAVPGINFFGVVATSLFIIGFLTPWFINKKPGEPLRPGGLPLLIWLVLMLFVTGENAAHRFDAATTLGAAAMFITFTAARAGMKR